MITGLYQNHLRKIYGSSLEEGHDIPFLTLLIFLPFVGFLGPIIIYFYIQFYKEFNKGEIEKIRDNSCWYKLKEHGGWL